VISDDVCSGKAVVSISAEESVEASGRVRSFILFPYKIGDVTVLLRALKATYKSEESILTSYLQKMPIPIFIFVFISALMNHDQVNDLRKCLFSCQFVLYLQYLCTFLKR